MRTIEQIDLDIDANRRALMGRIHCNPQCSARAWQNAWDRSPDLQRREKELFCERGEAQAIADREAAKKYQSAMRRARHHIRAAMSLNEDNRLSLAVQGRAMCREIDGLIGRD
jgi:hypothetical protein